MRFCVTMASVSIGNIPPLLRLFRPIIMWNNNEVPVQEQRLAANICMQSSQQMFEESATVALVNPRKEITSLMNPMVPTLCALPIRIWKKIVTILLWSMELVERWYLTPFYCTTLLLDAKTFTIPTCSLYLTLIKTDKTLQSSSSTDLVRSRLKMSLHLYAVQYTPGSLLCLWKNSCMCNWSWPPFAHIPVDHHSYMHP